jgi:Protein of unknown function (DUF3365)
MRSVRGVTCVCWLLLTAVPQAQSSLPPGTWRIADAPAELRPPIAQADLIVISMQDALLRELSRALSEGDPTYALQSCHIDVIGAIRHIERREGIAAGRTSDRLRNPANAPRAWAAPLVEANAGRLARDVDGFAVDLGSAIGVLRPVAERPMCASCHGPGDRIPAAVSAALRERYPADRAIGFAEGEIRGWFWVEVPKTPR